MGLPTASATSGLAPRGACAHPVYEPVVRVLAGWRPSRPSAADKLVVGEPDAGVEHVDADAAASRRTVRLVPVDGALGYVVQPPHRFLLLPRRFFY